MTTYHPIADSVKRHEAEAQVIMLRRSFPNAEITFRLADNYRDTDYRYDVLAARCNAETRSEMRGFLRGVTLRDEYNELAQGLAEVC